MFSQINLPVCTMQAFAAALLLWVAMPDAHAELPSSMAKPFMVELHQQQRSDGGTSPWSYKRVANVQALRDTFPGLKSLQIDGKFVPAAAAPRARSAFANSPAVF
ncbi:hypothetical protein [Variovorax rhizosphaerae]|uniref:Uncharacterized protein n=1 Tax=Variovorax rhizosphaerae TaxID=1836200 RepID=A0ABU8WSI8_9BURK